ncbi:MAG: c-type cytochrome [Isosphaeraceae bacterium]|nr:c-type cytochrome [Isosphaeraceae bacterium]
MPATEETYRKQSVLHAVFGITSIAMMLAIVWMILADHLRPWKQVQRRFHEIETAKLKAAERQRLEEVQKANQAELARVDQQLQEVERLESEHAGSIRRLDARIGGYQGRYEKLDTEQRFQKATLDSKRSFYDLMIDRDEKGEARAYLTREIVPAEQKLAEITRRYEATARVLNDAKLRKDLLRSALAEVGDLVPGSPAQEAGFRPGDKIAADDLRKLREQIESGQAATVRVPVRRAEKGGKETTTTIAIAVPERSMPRDPEEREFAAAEVWEQIGLIVTPVTKEVLTKRREDLTRKYDLAKRALEQKQRQYGEGGPLTRLMAAFRGLPIIDLAAPPTKIQQISLPELTINYNFKDVPRYDRCTTCHLGIDRTGYDKDAEGKEMPAVYRSHPHLTDGATAIDPKGNVVTAGLYLDANGPHKINSFGCTICHGGQGSGTTFTYASHEPNDLKQRHQWEQQYNWHEIHFWDEPMLPRRFLEASCLKCHHQVTDLPQAKKLQAGYDRITKYGCTGCHTIGGEGSFGPDLTDNRQVGPNLKHLGYKVSREWALKWIKNPHAFRPDTRMPRFYQVTNNMAPDDQKKVNAEVHAITHYLFATSTPPEGFVEMPAKGDADHGKELFLQKGCMACHANRPYQPEDLPKSLPGKFNEGYAISAEKTTPPESFPESVRKYARADFGPNLSSIAAKFPSDEQGYQWLANWIYNPEAYHPKTLMPNLQLSPQDAADIAAYLQTVKPDSSDPDAAWPVKVEVPPVDSKEVQEGVDELVKLYLSKAKVYKKRTLLLSEIDDFVAKEMSPDEKLMYLGEKTISRLGCFGCHNIKGFETAKPIGTPLNDWGFKSPSKLDFGHITEYLLDNPPGEDGSRDGTPEYYQEKLFAHSRIGFLFEKLHRPRSYDYQKTREDLKSWDDRLRMPQFSWADDPQAIEEVMTFVLGLTGEKINAKYLPKSYYTPAKTAIARGERLVDRYNCKGCHVFEMPKYTVPAGVKLAEALPDFQTNVDVSYSAREKDYPEFSPGLTYDPNSPPQLEPDENRGDVTFVGMPTATLEEEDENGKPIRKVSVQLWRPVTVLGYTFNVGDRVTINPDKVRTTDADGGNFAWLYATMQAEQTGSDFAAFWNRLPPPLLREGLKVQTPWLMSFLQDPYPIRPAVQLRMPRFHYGSTLTEGPATTATLGTKGEELAARTKAEEEAQGETRDLANYFAARDGAEFPYQNIPERERWYLSQREAVHPDYLAGGWTIVTKGLCIQCHAIGPYKPTGGADVVNGPDLRQVSGRFRPGYLAEWLAQPSRLVPYTAMPQNIPPHPAPGPTPPNVPKSFEGKQLDQVIAMRDMLLNYIDTIEGQLASGAAEKAQEKTGQEAGQAKTSGGGGH